MKIFRKFIFIMIALCLTLAGIVACMNFSTLSANANNLTFGSPQALEEATHTLHFHPNEGFMEDESLELETGASLADLPTPTREGYNFTGWFKDDGQSHPMTDKITPDSVMPDSDLDLYAGWEANTYSLYLNSLGGSNFPVFSVKYGEGFDFSKYTPERTGYTFDGWYENIDYQREVNQDNFKMPANDITFYAKWTATIFYINFEMGGGVAIEAQSYIYNQDIVLPENPRFANKTFVGWFEDSSFKTEFKLKRMPNHSITIYAKFIDKQQVVIDQTAQSRSVADGTSGFRVKSDLENFRVEYLIGNEWTSDTPTEVGTYDIRISRNEDATYASFEAIIQGGFVLTAPEINLNWLIIVLVVWSVLELGAIVIIRILKKMKADSPIAASLVPFFGYLLPSNQFVLLIVSAAVALFLFILMIYEIVRLHNYKPGILTSKDNLAKVEAPEENSMTEPEEQIVPIGTKYSAEDVENLLDSDNFTEQHKRKTGTKQTKVYESALDIAQKKRESKNFADTEKENYVQVVDKNSKNNQENKFNDSEEMYDIEDNSGRTGKGSGNKN